MANTFTALDYVLFGVFLLVSAGIGMFFALRDRKQASDMFTGGSKMQIIPTALSLMTSFLSGVTLLGIPVEIYKRGALYWLSRLIGTFVATLVSMYVVLPILFEFKPVSVYEYFELRFKSRLIRKCAALLYLFFMIAYMGVVLYAPAVALSGVTGVQTWIFYVTVGIICNLYTSFGGIKAVVWTDTFQAACMLVGLGALFFEGLSKNGGVRRTYQIAKEFGRFDAFANFDPNPFQYMTVWTSAFGGIGFWFTLITFNQISVQRYFSMSSLSRARKVLAISLPGYVILMILADLSGLVMFAYFLGCDPITSGKISKGDQLVIYYALDAIGQYPGLPGIFLACLFSGTLSTISSGINSMAAVAWEDFIGEHLKDQSERKKLLSVTVIALCFGFISMGMAAAAEPLGGILQVVLTVMGAIGGPICGLFLLGMLFPQANRFGALIGVSFSILLTGTVAIGNVFMKPYETFALELPVDQCDNNMTLGTLITLNGTDRPHYGGFRQAYALSEVFYPALGIILVLVIGLPVSLVLKDTPTSDDATMKEKRNISPVQHRLVIGDFLKTRQRDDPSTMSSKGRGKKHHYDTQNTVVVKECTV